VVVLPICFLNPSRDMVAGTNGLGKGKGKGEKEGEERGKEGEEMNGRTG